MQGEDNAPQPPSSQRGGVPILPDRSKKPQFVPRRTPTVVYNTSPLGKTTLADESPSPPPRIAPTPPPRSRAMSVSDEEKPARPPVPARSPSRESLEVQAPSQSLAPPVVPPRSGRPRSLSSSDALALPIPPRQDEGSKSPNVLPKPPTTHAHPSSPLPPPPAHRQLPKPPPRLIAQPALPAAEKPTTALTMKKLAEPPKGEEIQHREYAAKEILTTEETYVEQLVILIENYKMPILRSKMLKDEEVKAIFLNLESLLGIHQMLLKDLQSKLSHYSNETKFGDTMSSLIPMFKLYISYVNQYGDSIKLLNQCIANHPKLEGLIEVLGTGKFTGRLGLDSLRVVPIQRIPRYVLLLKQLLKFVPNNDPDYEPLDNAFKKFSELADLINEKKREQETSMRLIEIMQNISNQKDIMPECTTEQPHKWKTVEPHKAKKCDYCDEPLVEAFSHCKECDYRVHEACQAKIYFNCGEYLRKKTILLKHNRRLIIEWEDVLTHKMTSLKHLDAHAKVKEKTLVLLFNDGLAVLYPDSQKHSLEALIQWVSDVNPDRVTVLNENVKDTAFSLTHPDLGELHTFTAPTAEKKEEIVACIKKQIESWGTQIRKLRKKKQEENKTFEGVSFKITMTVPVASSHEKAFTAYIVDMTTQEGSISLIKRYSQFLKLHDKLKSIYKDVPEFPSKKLIGNMKQSVIQKRMRRIESYLNQVIKFPGILEIPEVHTFLTTTISAKGEEEEALIQRKQKDEEIEHQIGSRIQRPTSTHDGGENENHQEENNNFAENEKEPEEGQQEGGDANPLRNSQIERRGKRLTYLDILPKQATTSDPGGLQAIIAGQTGEKEPSPSTAGGVPAPTSEPIRTRPSSVFGMMSRRNKADQDKRRQSQAEAINPVGKSAPATTTSSSSLEVPPSSTGVKREQAVVLWDFMSLNDTELDMLCNDVVTIYEKSSDEWWFGTVNGRDFGFFPPTYVRVLSSNN